MSASLANRVPPVLEYLTAGVGVALGKEFQVTDGPPGVELGDKGVSIGWAPDELAVTTEHEPSGLSDDRVKFNIMCGAWSRVGSETAADGDLIMRTARGHVFQILTAVEEFIAKDPRLDRTVTRARLRFVDLEQLHQSDGTWALVVFTIACDAFI